MPFLNPLDALIPKIPFSFFAVFLGPGHLRGPRVSLGRIFGGPSIDPFFGGGGLARGLYRPPPRKVESPPTGVVIVTYLHHRPVCERRLEPSLRPLTGFPIFRVACVPACAACWSDSLTNTMHVTVVHVSTRGGWGKGASGGVPGSAHGTGGRGAPFPMHPFGAALSVSEEIRMVARQYRSICQERSS